MLKRAVNIFLIVVLLFGTAGVTITRHYCGKHLIQTAFYSAPEKCCEGTCPGCHNEKITLRITDKFESTATHIDFNRGFQKLLTQISLPTLLPFCIVPGARLLEDGPGGTLIKLSSTKPLCAGPDSPSLQVFLF